VSATGPGDAAPTGPASVTLVLHAHLSRHAAGQRSVAVPHRPGAPLRAYIQDLGIPPHEYYAVVRGGEVTKDLDAVPAAGEVIELLPAMSGG
jgi:molybdopterin converting factor small subunit